MLMFWVSVVSDLRIAGSIVVGRRRLIGLAAMVSCFLWEFIVCRHVRTS